MPAKTSAASKKTALHLERYVPGLLAWLSNKLARSASHIYRKQYGLGIVEWRILSYLAVFDIGTGASHQLPSSTTMQQWGRSSLRWRT